MATKSGDVCPECSLGQLGVYATSDRDGVYTRYLKCDQCKCTSKQVLKPCEIRRRRARVSQSSVSSLAIRSRLRPKTKFDVLKRDGFCCVYCGKKAPDVQLHVDHIVPVSSGGENDLDNLAAACAECNMGKGKRTA